MLEETLTQTQNFRVQFQNFGNSKRIDYDFPTILTYKNIFTPD